MFVHELLCEHLLKVDLMPLLILLLDTLLLLLRVESRSKVQSSSNTLNSNGCAF